MCRCNKLPGVHQENVDIQFDRNTLTISGTRAAMLPSREKGGQLRVAASLSPADCRYSVRCVRRGAHVNHRNCHAAI